MDSALMQKRLLSAMIVSAFIAVLMLSSADQSLATHVRCGDVVVADTRLDSNLVNCPGDGIVIGADNITLDLKGYTVDGDGFESDSEDPNDNGVDNSRGHDGVTIRNGAVQEFDHGIELVHFGSQLSATANRLRGLRVTRNNTGIELFNSPANRIERNVVSNNSDGMVFYYGSHGNRIERNVVAHNHVGLVIEGSNNNLVSKNAVFDSSFGIALYIAEENRVEHNSVSATNGPTESSGISLYDSDNNTVSKNTVFGNRFGILVTNFGESRGSDNNRIERNVATNNREDGIRVSSTLGPNPGLSRANVLKGNRTAANTGDGIRVERGNPENVIEGSRAHRNGDDGIDTDAPATLTRNIANENFDLGIEAVPGVIDGGGNRARGNGNPARCTNVACK
jgi:parallel beta-helix repeat protein